MLDPLINLHAPIPLYANRQSLGSSRAPNYARGCVRELYLLKKSNRKLKLMLSIGGWNWSTNFAGVAGDGKKRETFANSAVQIMKDWGFDGIDIDWEYPENKSEADDLLSLLKAVRARLDSYAADQAPGHRFQLSIAAPASPQKYELLPLADIATVVDYVFLMAYDYVVPLAGTIGTNSGHHANLFKSSEVPNSTPFDTDAAIQAYTAAGFPRQKLVMGLPLYGHSFGGTEGMGEPFTTMGSGEGSIWNYKDLPRPGLDEKFDDSAKACYSHDEKIQEVVSYDCPKAVEAKAAYVKEHGLGGIMFWEASADRVGSSSLIETSFKKLGTLDKTDNWLSYKDSRYDNIASNFDG
jgi:chitinase